MQILLFEDVRSGFSDHRQLCSVNSDISAFLRLVFVGDGRELLAILQHSREILLASLGLEVPALVQEVRDEGETLRIRRAETDAVVVAGSVRHLLVVRLSLVERDNRLLDGANVVVEEVDNLLFGPNLAHLRIRLSFPHDSNLADVRSNLKRINFP